VSWECSLLARKIPGNKRSQVVQARSFHVNRAQSRNSRNNLDFTFSQRSSRRVGCNAWNMLVLVSHLNYSSILKVKATCSFRMFGSLYTTWHYNPLTATYYFIFCRLKCNLRLSLNDWITENLSLRQYQRKQTWNI
jgi:hypothetical protein